MNAWLSVWFGLVLIACAAGCNESPRPGPVFEGVDLVKIVNGGTRIGEIPALRTTSSLKSEYCLKDCVMTLSIPEQHRQVLNRIIVDTTNTIRALGGKIVNSDISTNWGSYEVTYKTKENVGTLRFYSNEVDASKVRVVAVLMECPLNGSSPD